MTSPKPSYTPTPRMLDTFQVSALLGKGVEWFKKNRAKLEAEGFPKYDPLLGGTDGNAIEAWMDYRSGLSQAAYDDGALDKRLEEFANG